jgi:hypothetical protein
LVLTKSTKACNILGQNLKNFLEQFFIFIPTQLFKKFYLTLEGYRLAAMLITADTCPYPQPDESGHAFPPYFYANIFKKSASFVKVIYS